jgi:hypothetical protein
MTLIDDFSSTALCAGGTRLLLVTIGRTGEAAAS